MACINGNNFSAIPTVENAQNAILPRALSTFDAARSFAGALGDFAIPPVGIDVTFGDVGEGQSIIRPQRPNFDTGALAWSSPGDGGDPPSFTPGGAAITVAPDFDGVVPQINIGAPPGINLSGAPGPAPTIPNRDVPDEPGYQLPTAPALQQVLLPLPPGLNIPTWDVQAPDTGELPQIVEDWHFTPQQYVSALLDKIKTTVSAGLDGGIGLPEAIQEALWGRARDRVDAEELRAVQQVTDEFAALGHTEPNGILARRIDATRQAAQDQRMALNRDLTIEEAKFRIDNLRFMVQQGIALEGTLIGLHMQYQQLLLQEAQFLLDSAIRVFEARAALVRLAYDVFVAQAQAYKTQVEAELAKVEIYRAEVEAAKVAGEINDQLVRRYEAQIRAVNAMAEFYNARIRGFSAQVEADTARMEGFRAEAAAYAETIRGQGYALEAYKAQADVEVSRVSAFDSYTRAYAARVSAVNESNRVVIAREQLSVQQYEAQIRAHLAKLENIRTALSAEENRVRAAAAAFQAEATVYNADAQIEQAISAAFDRRYGLNIEKSRAAATIAVQNAQARIQENAQLGSISLEALRSAGQVLSQITSGAMSAINYSASISFGQSASNSCNANYQY